MNLRIIAFIIITVFLGLFGPSVFTEFDPRMILMNSQVTLVALGVVWLLMAIDMIKEY